MKSKCVHYVRVWDMRRIKEFFGEVIGKRESNIFPKGGAPKGRRFYNRPIFQGLKSEPFFRWKSLCRGWGGVYATTPVKQLSL